MFIIIVSDLRPISVLAHRVWGCISIHPSAHGQRCGKWIFRRAYYDDPGLILDLIISFGCKTGCGYFVAAFRWIFRIPCIVGNISCGIIINVCCYISPIRKFCLISVGIFSFTILLNNNSYRNCLRRDLDLIAAVFILIARASHVVIYCIGANISKWRNCCVPGLCSFPG